MNPVVLGDTAALGYTAALGDTAALGYTAALVDEPLDRELPLDFVEYLAGRFGAETHAVSLALAQCLLTYEPRAEARRQAQLQMQAAQGSETAPASSLAA